MPLPHSVVDMHMEVHAKAPATAGVLVERSRSSVSDRRSSPSNDAYWGLPLQEPNHSYVSSCAVESAQQGSVLMEWNHAPGHAKPTATATTADAPACSDEMMSSAAVANAAAPADPWGWVAQPPPHKAPHVQAAAGFARVTATAAGGATDAVAHAKPAPLQHHTTSRRLFANTTNLPRAAAAPGDQDAKAQLHRRLQMQAQQLQAELAFATQQLQIHNLHFGAHAVTLAR
jgi:hypothetical protein